MFQLHTTFLLLKGSVIRKPFTGFVIVMLPVVLLICLISLICPRDAVYPIDSLLNRDSTRFVPLSERQERILLLSNIVLQHQSTHAEWQTARESERMQARLSFMAAFGILLVALLRLNGPNIRSGVLLIAITLFFGFYFFDIQTVDFGNRLDHVKGMLDKTIIDISELQVTDSIWWNVDYKIYERWYSTKSQRCTMIPRKLISSLRPDASQMIFYFLPLVVLIFVYLWQECNEQAREKT